VNGDPNPQGAPPTNSAPLTAGDAAPTVEPGARSLRWPSWLSTGLIAALLGGGLVLIVLGVASGGSGSDSGGGTPAPAPSITPAAPPASAPTTAPSTRRPAAIKLDRRRIAERVSIGIPVGWDAGVTGGAVTVAARNRRSEVQVYFEQGAKGNEELARASRTFLLQRHPGARVAAAGRTDVGGRQATRTRVTYPGGTESAIVVVAGGYSYLILERLSRPASRAAVRTADAVTASFRPV
jgi:hypothetical protein